MSAQGSRRDTVGLPHPLQLHRDRTRMLSHRRCLAQCSFHQWLRYVCLRQLAPTAAAVQRLQRCRAEAAAACDSAAGRVALGRAMQLWARWLALRRVRAREAASRKAASAAAAESAEWAGRVSQLEQCVDDAAREQAQCAVKLEELLAERRGLRERVALLERGLCEARSLLSTSTARYCEREVELEARADALVRQLEEVRGEVDRWKREATQGLNAARAVFDSQIAAAHAESGGLRKALEGAQQQCDALRINAAAAAQQAAQARRETADCLAREREQKREWARQEEILRLEIAARMERIADLDKHLSEARGEVTELEHQVDARSKEQARLGAELGAVQDALAGEAERRDLLERSLREARESYESQIGELAGELEALRISARAAEAELGQARQDAARWEELAGNLRGQVLQQGRNRELLGAIADSGLAPPGEGCSAEQLQCHTERAEHELERLERQHAEVLLGFEANLALERSRAKQAAEERAAALKEIKQLQEAAAEREAQCEQLTRELSALRDAAARSELALQQHAADAEAFQKQLEAAKRKAALAQQARAAAESAAEGARAALATCRDELTAATAEADTARRERAELQRRLDLEESSVLAAAAKAEGRVAAAERKAAEAQEQVKKLQAEVLRVTERGEQLRRSDSASSLKRQDSVFRLHKERDQAVREAAELREQLAALQQGGGAAPQGGAEEELRGELAAAIAEAERMRQEMAGMEASMQGSTAGGSALAAARERMMEEKGDEIQQLQNKVRQAEYIKDETAEECEALREEQQRLLKEVALLKETARAAELASPQQAPSTEEAPPSPAGPAAAKPAPKPGQELGSPSKPAGKASFRKPSAAPPAAAPAAARAPPKPAAKKPGPKSPTAPPAKPGKPAAKRAAAPGAAAGAAEPPAKPDDVGSGGEAPSEAGGEAAAEAG